MQRKLRDSGTVLPFSYRGAAAFAETITLAENADDIDVQFRPTQNFFRQITSRRTVSHDQDSFIAPQKRGAGIDQKPPPSHRNNNEGRSDSGNATPKT